MNEYLSFGYIFGYWGLAFGILVPIPQLIKMIKTKKSNDVSITTYLFLVLAMTGYLIHAIYISAPVFIVSQLLNLSTNGIILAILIRRKLRYG